MKLREFSVWVLIGTLAGVVAGLILLFINRHQIVKWLSGAFQIRTWETIVAAILLIAVGACSVWWINRHPLLPTETRFELYGFEFFLRPAFFTEYRTTQLSNSSPEYIESSVSGPFCASCHRDRAQQIEEERCDCCGQQFMWWLRAKAAHGQLLGNRRELLKILKIEVFQEAQSHALSGKLRQERRRI